MVIKYSGTCSRKVLAAAVMAACLVWTHASQAAAAAAPATSSPSPSASTIAEFEIRGNNDVARLLFELPAGSFIDARLIGRGDVLELSLKGLDRAELSQRVAQFAGRHPWYKGARVVPGGDDVTRVQIEFTRQLSILDETIVALPGTMSRWEIVVGPAELAGPPGGLPPAAIEQISAARSNGRLDVVLSGSAGLVAEASFADNPPRLLVDLPGVPLEQATLAAAKAHFEAGLIRSVRAVAAQGHARLEFALAEPADLIDTRGGIYGKEGNIVMSLVPDATVKQARMGTLSALGFDAGQGVMQFRFSGVAGSRTSSYTIEDPPRLVVDFLGWEPGQLTDALTAFRQQAPALLGEARLDTTRLGSARAVFDLAGSAPLQSARSVTLPGEQGERMVETLLISLSPGAPIPSSTLALGRGPLDLRYRRELHDGRASAVMIRPPTLESASRYAQAALRPQAGKEYGLVGMLSKALVADPKYLAVKADFEAVSEAIPQARAALLPIASFDYQLSGIRQNVQRASNAAFPTGTSQYGNNNMTLTITQPLFKPQAWIKMSQAQMTVEQSKLNVIAAEQDLILRVSTSYLALLAANDGLELARAEREATEKQNDLAKGRLDSGLGTVVQRNDTEARLAINQAREIEAQSRVEDAKLALKEIVGEGVSEVRGFKADFDTALPVPSAYEPWVEAALEQNLAIQSRKLAFEIAGTEIRRQRAGHLPTVSLVGNLSHQDTGGSLYGSGQKSSNGEIGVRLSIPLTDGGLTSSLTREAVARKTKAEQEQEQEARRTERLTRSSFNGVIASSRSLEALRKSILAQESALQSRIQGFSSGLYNVVTVMDAYRLYYAAQRDYLQARYDYLINRLKLKQAVGTLSRRDLEDLAAMLN